MANIKITGMGGIAPRISSALLPNSWATKAENVDLLSGEIQPILEGEYVNARVNPCGVIKTLFNLQSTWLTWCKDVDVVSGFTPNDTTGRFYYTGDGIPKVSNYAMATDGFPYPARWFPLGVSNPPLAPLLTVNTVGTSPGIRFYVYTYVTAFEEESGPSLIAGPINAGTGASVTISDFTPSTHPNVNRIRIYRTLTGSQTTQFLFVAEIASNTPSYTDTLNDDQIYAGDVLNTVGWEPPPATMVGLNASPNGFLSGFTGNVLCYSEAYQPHAFPPQYQKPLDYPIIGCAWYGSSQVVCTTGFTYLVSGSDPRSLSVQKFPDPYPCVSKKSIASSNNGILYAADAGIVFAGSGGMKVITTPLLTQKTFKQFNPSSMRAAIQEGRYYAFYDNLEQTPSDEISGTLKGGCLVYDYNDIATGSANSARLNTLSIQASAVFADPVTPLHYIFDQTIYKYNSGDRYLTFTWKSKEFKFPYLMTLGAAKIFASDWYDGAGVTFRLYAGNELVFERTVNNNRPFRLPRFYKTIEYYVEVKGVASIQDILLAPSIKELNGANING